MLIWMTLPGWGCAPRTPSPNCNSKSPNIFSWKKKTFELAVTPSTSVTRVHGVIVVELAFG